MWVCWQRWGSIVPRTFLMLIKSKAMWEGEILSKINPQEKNQRPSLQPDKKRLTAVRTQPWK